MYQLTMQIFQLALQKERLLFWANIGTGGVALSYGNTGPGDNINCSLTSSVVQLKMGGHDWGITGLSLSGFNHFAFSLPPSSTQTDEWLIYINGVLQSSVTQAGTPKGISTTVAGGAIGQDNEGGAFFDGIMDDVRIYDRALSAAEIAGLASLGIS